MELTEAIAARRSVRGYLDRAVPLNLLRRIATDAARAATGGNLQPWHVDIVADTVMVRLKAVMEGVLAAGVVEQPGYAVYPADLTTPYHDRRAQVGEALYAHLGIPRADKAARRGWFADNFRFFGAPAALFVTVDRRMGPPQWADLGMYVQTVMLLAADAGLGSCAQECWAAFPHTVETFLETPAERMLFCGVAIGYEDEAASANRLRSTRAPVDEWLSVVR